MYSEPLIGNYVTLYGICIAVGIIVCILIFRWLGKKSNIDNKFLEFVETLGYVAILFGFLSAKLFQAFYEFLETGVFDIIHSGITFIGGLIGGAGSFILIYYLLRKKLTGKIIDILPIAPICIVIAHSFGRVGCFFAGCCGGRTADPSDAFYFLAMNFPKQGLVYPTQLFEAIFLLLLFGVLLFLFLKKDFKYGFVVYLLAYGVWRFAIEFLRGDDRGALIPGLTPSQFWSIIMVIGSVPLFFLLRYLLKTRDKETTQGEFIEVKVDEIISNEENINENNSMDN